MTYFGSNHPWNWAPFSIMSTGNFVYFFAICNCTGLVKSLLVMSNKYNIKKTHLSLCLASKASVFFHNVLKFWVFAI